MARPTRPLHVENVALLPSISVTINSLLFLSIYIYYKVLAKQIQSYYWENKSYTKALQETYAIEETKLTQHIPPNTTRLQKIHNHYLF